MTAKKNAAAPVKSMAKTAAKPAARPAVKPVAKPVALPAKAGARPASAKPLPKTVPAKTSSKAAAKAAEELKKKGAKGKLGPVGKKEDVRDEDFVDIVEAELEAETPTLAATAPPDRPHALLGIGRGLLSWTGLARMGLDVVVPRGPSQGDESLASFSGDGSDRKPLSECWSRSWPGSMPAMRTR